MEERNHSDLQHALLDARSSFYAAGAFSLAINFLMLVPTVYMLQLYDRVVPTGNSTTLVMLTFIVLFLFAVTGVLDWTRSQVLVRTGTRIEVLLRERLFQASFRLALARSSKNASSQPIDDFRNFRQFIAGPGVTAIFDAPCMPLYVAVMFLLHPWFGWAAVATAVVLVGIAVTNELATRAFIDKANRAANAGRGTLINTLDNAEVIESMGMSPKLYERWSHNADKVLALQSSAAGRGAMLAALSRHARMAAQSLVLGLGAYLAIANEISAGLMIAGSILLGRALSPIDVLVTNWKGFVNARAEYRRLNEVLAAHPETEARIELPVPRGALKAERAVIAPPGAFTPIIKNVSFRIDEGDTVGIIGPSGSGKSSLIRGLLGIWGCRSGCLRLDGGDVSQWNREQLGRAVGYLPQDIALFDGTVSENIARFDEVDSEAVVEAARLAGVHEMILALPEGYETRIGAGGCALSGGQRQRIGLARALYGKPALVVLDEPNSNLDEAGDAALHRALAGLRERGVTVLIVTHRPSVLRDLRKALVLQDGTVTAFGPTREVLAELRLTPSMRTPAIRAV
ncbi:MAG: type I secretion system permease/ATPase [Pseudomonadota bacterium]